MIHQFFSPQKYRGTAKQPKIQNHNFAFKPCPCASVVTLLSLAVKQKIPRTVNDARDQRNIPKARLKLAGN
jgi:hypothetical protein